MADIGLPPELAWLPIERLYIDPTYQRTMETPAGKRLIQRIADEFSWMKFAALLTTPGEPDKDGPRWLIIDGQHRTAGARRRGDIPHLPTVIFTSSTIAEQAAAFVGANRDRLPVSQQAIFYANLISEDPAAMTVKRLCDAAGIVVLRYSISINYAPIGSTPAASALLRCVKYYGEAATACALQTMAQIGGRVRAGLRGEYFLAIANWVNRGGDQIGLVDRIQKLGGVGWLAQVAGQGGSNQRAMNIRLALGDGQMLPVEVAASAAPVTTPRSTPSAQANPSPAATRHKPAAAPQFKPVQRRAKTLRWGDTPVAASTHASDESAIADFLATKGATPVMSPEQVASYLRKKGREATISLSADGDHWAPAPICRIGGRVVSLEDFYAAANVYRKAADLPLLTAPRSGPGWSLDVKP